MANAGNLTVRIGADTSGLERGERQAEGSMRRMGQQARQTANRLAMIGGAAAAAGAAIVTHLTRQGLEAVDAQAKLARALDGTIDGLRGAQLAAEDAGVATDTFNSAAARMNARLGEAARGTGASADALDRLGLNAQELIGMDVDQRMATIADRMNEMGLSGAQTADELRQLGIRNEEMVNFMRQGGDAIRSARDEVDALGISMDEVDAAKVEQANDAMSRIGTITEGISNQLAVQFAPILQGIAELFTDTAKEAGGVGDVVERVVDFMIAGAGHAANAVRGLQFVFKGVQLAGQELSSAILGVTSKIHDAFSSVFSFIMDNIESLVNAINKIPGVEIGTDGIDSVRNAVDGASDSMNRMAEASRSTADQTRKELQELAQSEMPSDALDRWVENVREKSQEAAEAAQENNPARVMVDPFFEAQDEMTDKEREELNKRLDRLREDQMDRRELLEMQYEEDLEMLREAKENELLTEQEFRERTEQLESDHMDKMTALREAGMTDMERIMASSWDNQVKTATDALVSMSEGVARHSKTAFEINKRAAQANAAIKGYQSAVDAWQAGMSVGGPAAPAIAAAFTALSIARTGAQIRAIGSQSFSGGGAASQATIPSTPVHQTAGQAGGGSGGGNGGSGESGQGGNNFNISLHGDNFSGEGVVGLIEQLNDAVGDGHQLNARMA